MPEPTFFTSWSCRDRFLAADMKIWITGASGFLGSALAQTLVLLGHHVVGLSRRPSSAATESCALDLSGETARGQLLALASHAGTPDVVVHAAARQPGAFESADYVRGGVLATSNLFDALSEFPPRLVIYTSTLSVYGTPERNPVRETDPVKARTHYGLSKLWSEQLSELFARQAAVVVLRLPSLYGVGQGDSFIDGLARQALRNEPIELFSNGRVIREALPASDVVTAILATIDQTAWDAFTVMNLGCGRPITSIEYAEALVTALETKNRIVPVERAASQPDLYADITVAQRRIAFAPTSLMQSMREYARALRA
jgi:nucleoside-diphosphate-sugar epimerase